jgi:nitroreductase
MQFDKNTIETILKAIQTSPSAHNSQPLKIKFTEDELVEIYAIKSRQLPFADPKGHDFFVTLGAFVQGLEIVLNHLGFTITEINYDFRDKDIDLFSDEIQRVARISVSSTDAKSGTLYPQLQKRFSYRGHFADLSQKQKSNLLNLINNSKNISMNSDKDFLSEIASDYDDVNVLFLNKNGYIEELYEWMRFKKAHSNYLKDGLNSEAISLNSIESLGASLIMKPTVFRFLSKVKLARPLVSEADKVKTSHSLIAIHAPSNTSALDQGKIFYKTWLELTELGIYCAPLSLLCEYEPTIKKVKDNMDINQDSKLINVFRVGALPAGYKRYEPARLPIEEYLLK